LQQTAARRRDLMPPTSRPWWSTTGSLVSSGWPLGSWCGRSWTALR